MCPGAILSAISSCPVGVLSRIQPAGALLFGSLELPPLPGGSPAAGLPVRAAAGSPCFLITAERGREVEGRGCPATLPKKSSEAISEQLDSDHDDHRVDRSIGIGWARFRAVSWRGNYAYPRRRHVPVTPAPSAKGAVTAGVSSIPALARSGETVCLRARHWNRLKPGSAALAAWSLVFIPPGRETWLRTHTTLPSRRWRVLLRSLYLHIGFQGSSQGWRPGATAVLPAC